ncbi:hypothetical protein [Erythrobacter rubeus]|uniref:Uncharacterized protein n=1 Tax=Erythrobacter rubeus TaxID=2760803 RepID=A0ABR8KPS3_9SPHN|nr:hypothetical protein [Erythrobacter rubeus]MBD2842721.1 hypothetical protein [Erythrobacter rubeus]
MAKSVSNTVLDAALQHIIDNATRMVACSQEPANYTEANSTYALADVTMAPGDFAIADGDSSGRKLTVAAKAGVAVDTTGNANHVALLDVTGTELLYVTTAPSQGVSSGGTVDFGTWDIEIADPT